MIRIEWQPDESQGLQRSGSLAICSDSGLEGLGLRPLRFDVGLVYPRKDGYHAVTLQRGKGTALKGFPNLTLNMPDLVMNSPAPDEDSARTWVENVVSDVLIEALNERARTLLRKDGLAVEALLICENPSFTTAGRTFTWGATHKKNAEDADGTEGTITGLRLTDGRVTVGTVALEKPSWSGFRPHAWPDPPMPARRILGASGPLTDSLAEAADWLQGYIVSLLEGEPVPSSVLRPPEPPILHPDMPLTWKRTEKGGFRLDTILGDDGTNHKTLARLEAVPAGYRPTYPGNEWDMVRAWARCRDDDALALVEAPDLSAGRARPAAEEAARDVEELLKKLVQKARREHARNEARRDPGFVRQRTPER